MGALPKGKNPEREECSRVRLTPRANPLPSLCARQAKKSLRLTEHGNNLF